VESSPGSQPGLRPEPGLQPEPGLLTGSASAKGSARPPRPWEPAAERPAQR